jgi:DNA-binding NarL/FixJ family response regulator
LNCPRILVADDQNLVVERVVSLLGKTFEVIGTVNNGKDLVAEAQRLQPDVIISDITMPMLTGIEAAQELRQIGSTSKLVFLTVHQEAVVVRACFAEGGLGYVIKSSLGTDLIPAIREALAGNRYISPSLQHVLPGHAHP